MTEQEKMSLDEAEELLNNFMRDARFLGTPASPKRRSLWPAWTR